MSVVMMLQSPFEVSKTVSPAWLHQLVSDGSQIQVYVIGQAEMEAVKAPWTDDVPT